MVKGNLMTGRMFSMTMLKKLLRAIIMKKPIPTPKQKGIVFGKPCCLAKTIAIKLLGPGVKLVMIMKTKKENTGMDHHLFQIVCYNVRNSHYNVVCFIIHNVRYIVYIKRRLDMDDIQLIFARNLKAIREREKLSLEKVSQLSGVSKAMVGQIERGESSPTLTTIWKIANGLKVSFTELIHQPQAETELILGKDIHALEEDNGKYIVYPHFPFQKDSRFEIYSIEIKENGTLHAEAHKEGTEEYLTVFDGTLIIRIQGEDYRLTSGDAIRFKADRPHTYTNPGETLARLSMTIYYPR